MALAPVDHLAMVLDMNREMNAPPNPMIAAKASSIPRSSPLLVRKLDPEQVHHKPQNEQDRDIRAKKNPFHLFTF